MISTMQVELVTEKPSISTIPRRENGDHLTRAEFERRYAAMVCVKKAELIEGMAIMPSPVSNTHSKANSLMVWWLVGYAAATPGTEVGDNATVRLDLDNEVQPDAHLRLLERVGGASHVDAAVQQGLQSEAHAVFAAELLQHLPSTVDSVASN